ncbi:MAG: signal peptidase I [Lachnospiraceae bacterium]|jgi:signal peptidase I|nr:signal peptidase I [Lachnospiraceae bacterium]MBR1849465.1 signal peptidase I [Lachnospiraceae bacterium]
MRRRNKGLSFYTKRKTLTMPMVKEILTWVFVFLLAILLAYVFVFFFGIRTSVIGNSMEPGIESGEEILINKFLYSFTSPGRGDVVVFRPNGNQRTHFYVKRVVGLPGETVQITDGRVQINGTFLDDEQFDLMEDGGIATDGIRLGEHEFFVLGDNRNSSEDSRSANIGAVEEDNIVGKAWFQLGGETGHAGFVK